MKNPLYLIQEEGSSHYNVVPLTPKNILNNFQDKENLTIPCGELATWTPLRLLTGEANGFVDQEQVEKGAPNSVETKALESLIGKIQTEFEHHSISAVLLSYYIGKTGYENNGRGREKYHATFTVGAVGCNIQKK